MKGDFIPNAFDQEDIVDSYAFDVGDGTEPLSAKATEFKELFCKRKGHTIRDGKLNRSFEKASRMCESIGADPTVYIDAHFYGKDPSKIFIAFLHGSNSEETYRKYRELHVTKETDMFEHFCGMLKRQLELGRRVEWILNNIDLPFPAWFRICISKEPIPSVMQKYKAMAKREMTEDVRNFLDEKGLDYKRITL